MPELEELQHELVKVLQEKEKYVKYNKLEYFDPYQYQVEFIADPSPQKALRAGNQIGKTTSSCALDAMHLTGRYPDWYDEDWWVENSPWEGFRPKGFEKFERPINMVVGCINNDKTRDVIQKALFGDPVEWEEELGTAWIPLDCVGKIQKKRGVPDAFYNVRIKHHTNGKFDGWSKITFLAYEMGKETWMGHKADITHMDEEPPMDILEQGGRSGIATGGYMYLSFTPENGATNVVKAVQNDWSLHTAEWKDVSGETYSIDVTTDKGVERFEFEEQKTFKGKNGHLTRQKVLNAIRFFRPHTIAMRMKGIPVLGTGLVFRYSEDKISCEPFEFPDHYQYLDGLDHGGLSSTSHPTAWARAAYDPATDTIYIYDGFKVVGKEIPEVAAYIVMRPNTSKIKTVWPHDLQKGADGDTTADQYAAAGVYMFENEENPSKSWATHPPRENEKEGEGGNRVMPAIEEMSQRMNDGRLKIFSNVNEFFVELRQFHMKDGKIVDIDDDFISAVRYIVMMIRHAAPLEEVVITYSHASSGGGWQTL